MITNLNSVFFALSLLFLIVITAEEKFPSATRDPCSPHKLTWISCTDDPICRVTALYLGSRNLHGPIPDFSSMDALQTIDLHGNFLSGPIPGFFTSFPNLTYLNLANNFVTVPLPDSDSNTKSTKFSYCTTYPYLCTCIYPYTCAPPSPVYRYIPPPTSGTQFPYMPDPTNFNYGGGKPNKPSKLPKILGFTIPPGVVAAIGGGCCFARRRRRNQHPDADAPPPPLPPSPPIYPYPYPPNPQNRF
ncbi:hypothetical protein MIMGU_mgv1a025669mg [Erythranthe guttata]|uniref:Leucine-rich repeat-containing N-terminal plant-type domain-containing protein n=1 Tax=Erythranthe guttata TaxID=4155 RepID=A0A022R892_ERYGU|nr:hypothetical protein MIMGU_mgv1a025669mg [Erythranthe guttata]